MLPKNPRPRPELQVPVPHFPLSSPISEEISSPSCSSAEDQDEQIRPFAFLSKATRQKIEAQTAQRESRRESSRLNFRGITKNRKSVAKPVGLNLVTDFALAPAPASKKHTVANVEGKAAPFVDLNDLQLLSKAREKERTAQKSKFTPKKRVSRGFQPMPDEPDHSHHATRNGGTFLDTDVGNPFHDRHENALSPSDRNVMIGLTVPHDESIERSRERDDPGTPLTPSILITPANEDALWKNHSNTSTEMLRPRVASSVYSQPTPRLYQFDSDVPPVPAIPAQHSGMQRGFVGGNKNTDVGTRNQRPTSVDTWEDASLPPTPRSKGQTLSVNADPDADRPQSQGWWNVLLSPLLGRSIKSPVSPSFPRNLPSTPPISTTPAREGPKDWPREKEISCFSPDTPATPGLVGENGRTGWHERGKEISCFSPDTPETAAPMAEKAFEFAQSMEEEKYHKFQPQERHQSPPPAYASNAPSRQNTMSFIFNNGQTTEGEAAEYYQACAHELFSKTPYFQCVNHICSLTPDNVAIPPGADGNRSMAFTAVDLPNAYDGLSGFEEARGNTNAPAPAADAATSNKAAGLLIDIDSPRPTSIAPTTAPSGYAVRAKEIQVDSPASATTVDSWDSAVTSDDRKSTAPPPAPISRKPVPVPVPAPASVSIEETEREISEQPVPAPAPAPAPIPMPEPTPAPAQAPPQIITNVSPPVTNVHYPPHPEPQPQAQLQPIIVPQYVPVFPPSQPGPPAEPFSQQPMVQEQQPHEQSRGISDTPDAQQARPVSTARSEWPWGQNGQQQPQPQIHAPEQAQKPISQELFKDFEWAYDQHEPQQAATGTQAPPRDIQASREPAQPTQLSRAPSQRPNNLQAPLVVQGRQSGSGWPFAQNAHPHSHAPPVASGPQTLSDEPEAQYQQRQLPEHSSPVEDQVERSGIHSGERGLPRNPGLAPTHGQSRDPEPISPGFQRAAGGPGSIPMADMPAPAPAYSQRSRHSSVPPRYGLHPPYQSNYVENATIVNPDGAVGPHEARRRRLEDEEKFGRKACGLRGLFKMKNGRAGREGRTRRRWYFLICLFFFAIVIVAIVLAVTLTRKGASSVVQSQWLNLTGYPPMPTGIATLAGTEPQLERSTCITPSSMWSCALPKSQQDANEPYDANQPNFRVSILFRNGTYDNSTTVASSTSSRRVRRDDQFNPSPAAPGVSEQSFIGQYTDNNTAPYAGEETPFYMSMLSPVSLASTNIYRRADTSNATTALNISAIIPAPDENSDGSAAAAMLYPLPSAQPVRLYNRGLSNEHYGFYTYFDKSIFLTSQETAAAVDSNGGTTKEKAKYRCTWSQTRFLVQIWTQGDKMNRQLLPYSNNTATSTSAAATPTSTSTTPTSSSSATDFSRPGSFPYPVTITLDRHGGAAKKKMVYCYPLEDDGHYNITGVQLQLENRSIGGEVVNAAGGLFKGVGSSGNSTGEDYGGTDGGSGGCGCQWVNWISTM